MARSVPLALVLAAWFVTAAGNRAVAQQPAPDTGNIYPLARDYAVSHAPELSYLARDWPDTEQWRIRARAKMQELLGYDTNAAALDPVVYETIQRTGYTCRRVSYAVAPGRRTEAFVLVPDNLDGPAPAVIALHDHGGFYFFGKEKHTLTDNPPEPLKRHIDRSYGGRQYADELVRHGFVVLCPDAFYFGSQRIDDTSVSERVKRDYPGLSSDEPGEHINAFNRFASQMEQLTAKTLFTAGTTWPGILFQGDRASVDYLLTLPEVDPGRIGCMGLSIGGFRSAHLFGLDPRIGAAVVAGWMTTYDSLLFDDLLWHTWMIYVPRQFGFLDLPDVASLNAPRPLMVINCLQDTLFPIEGMNGAERKLTAVYGKMGAPDHFKCNYYDVPHSLDVRMQDDAIAWLEQWLKSPGKSR